MDRESVNWCGYIPAVTTPFTSTGALDLDGAGKLLQWMFQQGMHGVLIGGTQGEWFSWTPDERRDLYALVKRTLAGKMTLIAGCSAYTAAGVAENARLAKDNGFDGILVTAPPYIVPTDDDIVQFFWDVSDSVDLPICVYNWPPGTNIDLSLGLMSRLADVPKVVAIKNSTPDLRGFIDSLLLLNERVRVFGVPMNAFGVTLVQAHGAVGTMGAGGVLGHELPDYFNAAWRGDARSARHFGDRNDILMRDWFKEDYTGRFGSAQAVFKAALNELGLPGGIPRRPLMPLGPEGVHAVQQTLRRLGKI